MSTISDKIKAAEEILKAASMKVDLAQKELLKARETVYNLNIDLQTAQSMEADYYEEDEENGDVVITLPISDKALKELCNKPLLATSDGDKLKELERRFPKGVFVLTTESDQYEINSVNSWYSCDTGIFSKNRIYFHFKSFGGNDKPQLMVEWNNLFIDLSHLF